VLFSHFMTKHCCRVASAGTCSLSPEVHNSWCVIYMYNVYNACLSDEYMYNNGIPRFMVGTYVLCVNYIFILAHAKTNSWYYIHYCSYYINIQAVQLIINDVYSGRSISIISKKMITVVDWICCSIVCIKAYSYNNILNLESCYLRSVLSKKTVR